MIILIIVALCVSALSQLDNYKGSHSTMAIHIMLSVLIVSVLCTRKFATAALEFLSTHFQGCLLLECHLTILQLSALPKSCLQHERNQCRLMGLQCISYCFFLLFSKEQLQLYYNKWPSKKKYKEGDDHSHYSGFMCQCTILVR